MYKMNGGFYFPQPSIELDPVCNAVNDKPTQILFWYLLNQINNRKENIDYRAIMTYLNISKDELDRELALLQKLNLITFRDGKPTLAPIYKDDYGKKPKVLIEGKNMNYRIYISPAYCGMEDEDDDGGEFDIDC